MDSVFFYCKNCRHETKHEVISISNDNDSGWFEVVIKCDECGKEHQTTIYN